MSDVKDLSPDLDKLDSQIDDLEDALQPLIADLDGVSSQLPLLDKAKLFSLTAYSIESLLFSSLRLQGADAQNHPVYAELKRVQQYFSKIKAVEEPEPEGQRSLTVNKEATARVLKADLGDNKALSGKLADKIAEERAKALLKSADGKPGSGKKRAAEGESTPASTSAGEGQKSKKKKHKHKEKRMK